MQNLATLGDPAAQALVPLLRDPNSYVQESAGMALAGFSSLKPEYLNALVFAWRSGTTAIGGGPKGNGWLPRAIAATGTAEAFRLLWADFIRDPSHDSNSQVVSALRKMGGKRFQSASVARLRECQSDIAKHACQGVLDLLHERGQPFPDWSVPGIVALALNAAADETRLRAEGALVEMHHPVGLAGYSRRLEDRLAHLKGEEWKKRLPTNWLIDGVASYGPAARSSGPALARIMQNSSNDYIVRRAALALGRVQDQSSVPALLEMGSRASDDWSLTYNVVESLGMLRAPDARPFLEKIASSYWHVGVRRNANRALDALDGKQFAPRPAFGSIPGAVENLRTGDGAPTWCSHGTAPAAVSVANDPVGQIPWPRAGARLLEFDPVKGLAAEEIRKRTSQKSSAGDAVAALTIGTDRVFATNGGEFGGGLYVLPTRGRPLTVFEEPVVAVWRMGGKIFAAAGLAHLLADGGHLYVLDANQPRVLRRIALPATPQRLIATTDHVIVIQTAQGDMAISESGDPVDPTRLSFCWK